MISKKELNQAREIAANLELEGRELLFEKTDEDILSVINGIGPEWFPPILRKTIDEFNPSLVVAAMIHDLEWHFGDGTKEHFDASNARFRRNGYRVAMNKYAWYSPRRYLVMRQSRRFARLCQMFGWPTYRSSVERRKEMQYEIALRHVTGEIWWK